MFLAADYPLLDVIWTMVVFFLWIMWFWLLFSIWGDVFRRTDLSGLGKAGWLIFTIVLPFLGVFIYLIAQSEGMARRNMERVQAQQSQFDQYVRERAGGGAAAEIAQAQALLERGAITATEYEAIKQKALA